MKSNDKKNVQTKPNTFTYSEQQKTTLHVEEQETYNGKPKNNDVPLLKD